MKPQRSTAVVICGLLFVFHSTFAQTWMTNSFPLSARSVASSADGCNLVLAAGDGGVFTSTNSGATWTQSLGGAGIANAYVVASSADGTILFADDFNVSTNSGTTWNFIPSGITANGVAVVFEFIACSADGSRLLVAGGTSIHVSYPYLNLLSSPLYTSPDSGMTWVSNNAPVASWQAAAASADGTKLVAVINGGGIYTSTNFGITWVSNNVPNEAWTSVACSADGGKVVATSVGGGIFNSVDSGQTWAPNAWISNNLPNSAWISVASSADGNKLVATTTGNIYSSTNSGNSWTLDNAPVKGWGWVASSADGNKYVTITPGGNRNVWTLQISPAPQMIIAPTNSSLALSWIIPSTNFVLQQNLDLTTENWTDVTNTPVLNLTKLQDEVTLPVTNGSSFYRLVAH